MIASSSLLLLLLTAQVSQPPPQDEPILEGIPWSSLGGSSDSDEGVSADPLNWPCEVPSIATDGATQVVIAWARQGPTGYAVHAKRWSSLDQRWSGFGKSDEGPGIGDAMSPTRPQPQVALGASGAVFVAWDSIGAAGKTSLFVRRYDPVTDRWVSLGTAGGSGEVPGTEATDYGFFSLAANPVDSTLYLAYSPALAQGVTVKVLRWDGAGWIPMDRGGAPIAPASHRSARFPRIAVDAAGRPWLAWNAQRADIRNAAGSIIEPGGYDLYLVRWNGQDWEGLGGSDTGRGISRSGTIHQLKISLALHPSQPGRASVAWTDWIGSNACLFVRSWDDATPGWQSLAFPADRAAPFQAMKIDQLGRTWVLSPGSGGFVQGLRYDLQAGLWQSLDDSVTGGPISGDDAVGSFAFDLAPGGWPMVCWSASRGYGTQIYAACSGRPGPSLRRLAQFRDDGTTPVPPGGALIDQSAVRLALEAHDLVADTVQVEVELRQVGGSVLSRQSGMENSGSFGFDFSTLPLGRYQWRARVFSSLDDASGWICYGTNPDDAAETDFLLRTNAAPIALDPRQLGDLSGNSIAPGALLVDEPVRFSVLLSDPDSGDQSRLEVEVRRVGETFSGQATAASDFTAGGPVSLALALPAGDYRWSYRSIDDLGLSGAWHHFSPGGQDADFSVRLYGGSLGTPAGCLAGAGAGTALPAAIAILLLARTKRVSGRRGSSR